MKDKYKVICLFPFYLITVIIACIIMLPISWFTMIVHRAYLNPIKLKWMYFDGNDYCCDYDDFIVQYLFSPLVFSFILMIIPIFIKFWFFILLFAVGIAIVVCLFYLSRGVTDMIFVEKEESDENEN